MYWGLQMAVHTPWKINGWNLQNHLFEKGTSSSKPSFWGGSMLTFRGVLLINNILSVWDGCKTPEPCSEIHPKNLPGKQLLSPQCQTSPSKTKRTRWILEGRNTNPPQQGSLFAHYKKQKIPQQNMTFFFESSLIPPTKKKLSIWWPLNSISPWIFLWIDSTPNING